MRVHMQAGWKVEVQGVRWHLVLSLFGVIVNPAFSAFQNSSHRHLSRPLYSLPEGSGVCVTDPPVDRALQTSYKNSFAAKLSLLSIHQKYGDSCGDGSHVDI